MRGSICRVFLHMNYRVPASDRGNLLDFQVLTRWSTTHHRTVYITTGPTNQTISSSIYLPAGVEGGPPPPLTSEIRREGRSTRQTSENEFRELKIKVTNSSRPPSRRQSNGEDTNWFGPRTTRTVQKVLRGGEAKCDGVIAKERRFMAK